MAAATHSVWGADADADCVTHSMMNDLDSPSSADKRPSQADCLDRRLGRDRLTTDKP